MRIVPRLNEAVNEEWISDKARFQYDGLKRQRLNVPLMKGADGVLAPASWSDALTAAANGIKKAQGNSLKAIAGKLADAESIIALKVCTKTFNSLFEIVLKVSQNLNVDEGAPEMHSLWQQLYQRVNGGVAKSGMIALYQSKNIQVVAVTHSFREFGTC